MFDDCAWLTLNVDKEKDPSTMSVDRQLAMLAESAGFYSRAALVPLVGPRPTTISSMSCSKPDCFLTGINATRGGRINIVCPNRRPHMFASTLTRVERRRQQLRQMRERLGVTHRVGTPGAAFWSACEVRRCALCGAAAECERWLGHDSRADDYRDFCPNAHELDLPRIDRPR
jgi:hypothetical protein